MGLHAMEMVTSWDYRLVALSFAIAILGSYVALDFAGKMKAAEEGTTRRFCFIAGALSMGLAVWTMHFVGMLAMNMNMPITYDTTLSIVSIAAAATGAGIAFSIMNKKEIGVPHLIMGSIAMGLAIVIMHYLGMASMKMNAVVQYTPWIFALSIVIAITASAAALWIAFQLRIHNPRILLFQKIASAVVMGFAISGMHYTGMAAAHYYSETSVVSGLELAATVGDYKLSDILILASVVFGFALLALSSRSYAENQIVRDLNSKIQSTNELLQQKAQQLETVNKELEAFSYSVSHDLRAPLRTIDGFSQALLEDYSDKLDDKGKEYLQFLRSGSQKMAALIDDMLELSRLTRGTLNIEDDVDLSKIAKEIANDLQREEPERKVQFEIADGSVVRGDKRLLQAVLENLMGNAWKFTSKHPTACIEFKMTMKDGKPVFYVKDDGAGLDMNYSNKLFSAFQRLHGVTEFPGTGIGLASVARIIHRHGGEVWVEGEVEKGATFYFTIDQIVEA